MCTFFSFGKKGLFLLPNTARMAGMSRRNAHGNARYGRGDDPIDWSAFDEEDSRQGPVSGSTALRIVSVLMIVAGIAGIIGGVNEFGAEIEQLGNTGEMGSFAPVFVAIGGALTLIPAAFGLQIAGNPVSFVPPTVLGLAGILIAVVMAGMSIAGSSPVWPWIAALLLALLYLYFVVRVHKAANAAQARQGAHSRGRRPTKDELWDEKNIWK